MRECYLCGSDLSDHGPPLCGPCNEMTARGNHGLSLDAPAVATSAARTMDSLARMAGPDALEGD